MARRDRQRPPARRLASLEVRKRILVVCEGAVTEPGYLRGLVAWCKNPLVSVEIAKKAGDPSFVVGKARELKHAAQAEARRERDDNIEFDEVWCVIDVDEHKHLHAALDMAKGNGLQVALSNPCFELWVLLHFRENPGMQERHACQNMVKTFITDYGKHLSFAVLQAGYPAAVKRARRLDEDARSMGEEGRNPSTGVYRLTELIRTFDDPGSSV